MAFLDAAQRIVLQTGARRLSLTEVAKLAGVGVKSPVEVSAEILATLRYRAEDTFADDLFGARLVPMLWLQPDSQLTKSTFAATRAGYLAGCTTCTWISSPTTRTG